MPYALLALRLAFSLILMFMLGNCAPTREARDAVHEYEAGLVPNEERLYDNQRIADIMHLSHLMEKYKKVNGHYPLADQQLRNLTVLISNQPLATLLPSIAKEGFDYRSHRDPKIADLQLLISQPVDHTFTSSSYLAKMLRKSLGNVHVPVDPSPLDKDRPGYYIYHLTADGRYYIAAHLRHASTHTRKIAPNYHKYEITSSFSQLSHPKARIFYSIPNEEIQAIFRSARRPKGYFFAPNLFKRKQR